MTDRDVRTVIDHFQAAAHLKLTLAVLARFTDELAECYPSYARIGTMTGVTARQAERNVDELVRLGVVEKVRRRSGGSGKFGSNVYRLKLDHLTYTPVGTEDTPADTDDAHQLTLKAEPAEAHVSGRTEGRTKREELPGDAAANAARGAGAPDDERERSLAAMAIAAEDLRARGLA